MSNLRLSGEILDIGCESRGIIYKAIKYNMYGEDYEEAALTADIKNRIEDCDWVYGHPEDMPFEDDSFDTAASFFSLSIIKRKYMRNKTIKELARTLRKKGKLYIWDININKFCINLKREIKVILPHNENANLIIRQTGYPKSYGIDSVVPVVERYFIIKEKKDFGKFFYIEAMKRDDSI